MKLFSFFTNKKERFAKHTILSTYKLFGSKVNKAKSLKDLMDIHKHMWLLGYRGSMIEPNKYGVFRTQDINEMLPSEVFLGNIYGLLTKPLPEWERYKDTNYGPNGFGVNGDTKIYSLIMNQYKSILMAAIYYNKEIAEK